MSFRGRGGSRGRGGRGFGSHRPSPYMPYNRLGGRGEQRSYGPASFKSSPPPRDNSPHVPVRASGRGVGPDGTAFDLSFEIDLPVSCLKVTPLPTPEANGFTSQQQRPRTHPEASAGPESPEALELSRGGGGPPRRARGDETAIVIPSHPESPTDLRSNTMAGGGRLAAPSWLPSLCPLPRSRFPFVTLFRLFTARGGPSSTVLDSYLALAFAMHSTVDLRGVMADHRRSLGRQVSSRPYELPCIFKDVLSLMDQLHDVNCTGLAGEAIKSSAGPALDAKRTVLRRKWASVGEQRGLLTGGDGSGEEEGPAMHGVTGLPTDWVRLSCLPSGPEEEKGQYLMEHVMGLELSVTGRCPKCLHELTRSTCDIPHAAELLPMIELDMGCPKPLDHMIESFYTSRKTAALLPHGLVDNFVQDFMSHHPDCGVKPLITTAMPNAKARLGPSPPFLWINIDKNFAVGNHERVRKALTESTGGGALVVLSNGVRYMLVGTIFTYVNSNSQQQYACEMRLGDRLCDYDNLDDKRSKYPETAAWVDDRGQPTGSQWRLFSRSSFPEHERWGVSALLYQLQG